MTGTTRGDERAREYAGSRHCERSKSSRPSVGRATLVDTATVEHRSVYREFQEIPVASSGLEVDDWFDGEGEDAEPGPEQGVGQRFAERGEVGYHQEAQDYGHAAYPPGVAPSPVLGGRPRRITSTVSSGPGKGREGAPESPAKGQ